MASSAEPCLKAENMEEETKKHPETKDKVCDEEKPCMSGKDDLKKTACKQPRLMTNPKLIRVIILFCVLNVMMLALIITTMVCYVEEASTDHIKYSPPMCVKCDNLRTRPVETWTDIEQYEDICCVNKPEHVSTMVSKYTENWVKRNITLDSKRYKNCESEEYRQTKPLIKLVGLNSQHPVTEWGHHHRLMWDPRSDMAIIENTQSIQSIAFNAKHSTIEIMKSGLYFVYSQVAFEHKMTNETNSHPVVYTHRVVRANPNDKREYDDVIMTSIQTPCHSNEKVHEDTSYIGGAFQLQRGDTLSVKVNRRLQINSKAHMNFFGAQML